MKKGKKNKAARGGQGKFTGWIGDLIGRPRYLVYAILLHAVFLSLLLFSMDWHAAPVPPPPVNIVEAVVVDESKVLAEMEKLRLAEERKKLQAQEARKKREQEEKRLAELKKKREAEQRRLREQEKKRQAEAKRVAELKKKREAEQRKLKEQEKKRKEEEKKRKAAEEKARREAEKRKEKEARLAALKKEEEELERRRRAEEEQRRKQAEKELQAKLALEQQRLEAEKERKARGVVEQYVGLITQKVERNWLRPGNIKEGLSCEVMVRLIPGGEVVSVQITQSSGDPVFDRSVERAVRKASPLPLPDDSSMFPYFRELKFIFKPGG